MMNSGWWVFYLVMCGIAIYISPMNVAWIMLGITIGIHLCQNLLDKTKEHLDSAEAMIKKALRENETGGFIREDKS